MFGGKTLKAELYFKYYPKNSMIIGGVKRKFSPQSFVQWYFYTLLC